MFMKWFCFTSVLLFLMLGTPALSLADTSVAKGSLINQYNPDLLDGWTTSHHETPAIVGTLIEDGRLEYHPAELEPCNWTSFGMPGDIGLFTTVPPWTFSTATVVVRRMVQSGTVTTPGSLDSTIVASTVDYTIQEGPAQAVGVTLRRSDWESGVHTGTTFSYFRTDPNLGTPYFHGHVEGDIHAVFRFMGTDAQGNPITETRRTSLYGIQNTEVSTVVWDNPVISVIEPEVVLTGVQILIMDGVQFMLAGSSPCFPDTGNVNVHSGTSFFLPALNVGHYRGTYYGTINPDFGVVFNYAYTKTDTTEVVPRVIGLLRAGAQHLIVSNGFTVKSITRAHSNVYPAGRVISQSAIAGSLADLGSAINLIVSDGPDPCECDLNADGRCDMLDWLLFGQRWGATNCNTVPCACDLNDDGRCDMRDWLIFGQDWGRTDCPTP